MRKSKMVFLSHIRLVSKTGDNFDKSGGHIMDYPYQVPYSQFVKLIF
ncbi:hypothetical protein ACE01N_07770 [Saccharicrinis sp. FJH2]